MAEQDDLRTAYAAASSGEGEHLSEERWERLACDELKPAEQEVALSHVLSCVECTQAYRAVLAIREEAHAFDPGAPRPRPAAVVNRRPAWRRVLVGLATAAALISVFSPSVRPLIRFPCQRGPGGSQPIASCGRVVRWRCRFWSRRWDGFRELLTASTGGRSKGRGATS